MSRDLGAAVAAFAAVIGLSGVTGGPAAQSGRPTLVDRTSESRLDFIHDNGATGNLWLPEVIGGGGAVLDYDNDGDLDLFAVQSGALTGPAAGQARSRLFRNDLQGGAGGRVRFTDATGAGGITAGYGIGATAGDFDNDGWVDLYVASLGPNQLLRNNGNGTFTDVTAASRTGDPRWSAGASFFDYDRDGWLDLYVANYVHFRIDMKRACFSAASAADYCNPVVYEPVSDSLFRNNGDGSFTDVSARAGITTAPARGLGVLATDVNGDGWTDVYVANDGDPNQLWINEGGRRFRDEGLLSGVALNRAGRPQGSMGIDAGDVDGDGDEELFVTNLDSEGNTLYLNVGTKERRQGVPADTALFEDRTVEARLHGLGFTGFGTRFFDYDNDGWLDVAIVNGAVRKLPAQARQGDAYPLRQPAQLFRNAGKGRFVNVSGESPALATPQVGRGLATGDLDNDGDVDLIIFNNNGAARLLLNEGAGRQHWLGLRVLDAGGKRDALQARVELVRRGAPPLVRRVQVDGSYAVANDPRVLFGLGTDAAPRTVRVRWPTGQVEEFAGLAVDRYWTLQPGRPPR